MSTHPYIPLFVDDFEAATAHLTPEEDGIYNRLLRLCWRTPGCSIPNDAAWIARKVRLSADDFERVAKPVIDEFFKVQRGRLVQKRLKAEYDDITRKKAKRANAGKKGGEAKALKTKENIASNATDLLGDTRAFPDPDPDPDKQKDAIASSVGTASPVPTDATSPKGKRRVYPEAFEAAWKAYPHHENRSSKPNSLAEWKKLPADEREGLVAAIERFKPKVETVCGGKGARCMSRWLKDGLHLNWMEGGSQASAPARTWSGPGDVRAAILKATDSEFVVSYLDPCEWREGPPRVVVAPNEYVASRLRKEAGRELDRLGIELRAKKTGGQT